MAISPALSEVEGEPVSDYPKSIFSMLAEQLRKSPHNTAIVSTHQTADYLSELIGRTKDTSVHTNGSSPDYLSWSFQELHNASLRLVAGLRAQGIGPGSTVVTIMPNGVEWLLLYWSSFVGRFALCPLDFGVVNASRAGELIELLSICRADAVFVADTDGAGAVDKVLSSVQKPISCKVIVTAPPTLPEGWTALRSNCPDISNAVKQQIEQEAEDDEPDRTTFICFTSGTTTGQPKGCAKTVLGTTHSAICQPFGYDLGPATRHMVQTQNFRVIAASMTLGTWKIGGAVVMPGAGFYPDLMLDAITKHKITSLVLVPAMIHILRAHSNFPKTDRSSVQTIFIGADIITRDLYEKAAEAFPDADIVIGHGMTEGGGVVQWPFYAEKRRKAKDLPWYASIGTLGQVGRGTKIRISDENNRPVKRGEVGELHVSNPSFITEYLGGLKPEDFYQEDMVPWFKTGDIALLDDEGYLYILGRRKDIVKRAGVSIMPGGLESCIDEFLKSQTSVIAVSHPILGQVPFAIVKDLNGRSKQDVEQRIIDYFGKDSSLGGVATLADLGLDRFPLNKTEKIVKRELEAPVATYLAASGRLS